MGEASQLNVLLRAVPLQFTCLVLFESFIAVGLLFNDESAAACLLQTTTTYFPQRSASTLALLTIFSKNSSILVCDVDSVMTHKFITKIPHTIVFAVWPINKPITFLILFCYLFISYVIFNEIIINHDFFSNSAQAR